MECPQKWERVGNGLQNLQELLLTVPDVVRVHQLFAGEVRRLGFEDGAKLLFSHERKERSQTTLQAKSYLLGKIGVDQIGIGQAAWMVMRLQCACDFLGQMFPPMAKDAPCAEMPDGWTPETTAAWLLTELWERRSDHWLKLVAMEWVGPFPFYGIEVAPEWL
jgi:hypothetical protein